MRTIKNILLWISAVVLVGSILFFKVTFEMSARRETIGTVTSINERKSWARIAYRAKGTAYSSSLQTGAVLDHLQVGERFVVEYADRFPILSEVNYIKPCISDHSKFGDANTSKVKLLAEGQLLFFWYQVNEIEYKRLQWVDSSSVSRFDSLTSYPVKYRLSNPASAFVCINEKSCWVNSADSTRLHKPRWRIF